MLLSSRAAGTVPGVLLLLVVLPCPVDFQDGYANHSYYLERMAPAAIRIRQRCVFTAVGVRDSVTPSPATDVCTRTLVRRTYN